MKTILFTSMCLLGSVAIAHAGGKEGTIGVGIESQLATTGVAGFDALSLNYDAGKFHVGGFIGYDDPAGGGNTFFEIGARFFYHVHTSPMSDFGVGGSIGIALDPFVDGMNNAGHHDDVYIEPAFQFRAFITPNVALSFTGGLIIGTVDTSGVDFGGNVEGLAGIHYYFF